MKFFKSVIILLVIALFSVSCNNVAQRETFTPINGLSDKYNKELEVFLENNKDVEGRKIAVFDGDGTVMGQTPHYLADECMYQFAKEHPEWHKEIIDTIIQLSNVSLPYVQFRVKYMAGKSLQFYRDLGEKTFNKYYKNKIFKPVKEIIANLKKNNFEIWIVTASPEGMYQQFLSDEFNIPITNIIGVKSVIQNGIITDRMVTPVPQDRGKMEAIETFIQGKPLFVAGNSRGDKEMIEFSKGLKMIINPDEHVAPGQKQSISDYAKSENWMIVNIKDIPAKDFPLISSRNFGIRKNKTRK